MTSWSATGGLLLPQRPHGVRPLHFDPVLVTELVAVHVDHPLAGWLPARVDPLLYRLEALVRISYVPRAGGGEIHLRRQQVADVLPVGLKRHWLRQRRR